MKLINLFAFLLCLGQGIAQKHAFIHFKPMFGNLSFSTQTTYTGIDGVAVNIDHFDYYVSEVILFHDGGTETPISPKVFLISPDSSSIYLGELNINSIDSIRFSIGVPSRWNTQSGSEAVDISTYPENHPLSFQSPSMYWGWLFGYMHMIVGGDADSNNDQIPDAYFELHNIGDQNQRTLQMPVIATNTAINQVDIYLECHVDQWLRNLPLNSLGILHDQVGLNDTVMANVNQFPVFTQPQNAAIIPTEEPYFYTNQGTLHWGNIPGGSFEIYDFSGRKIYHEDVQSSKGSKVMTVNPGYYFIYLHQEGKAPVFSKKCLFTQL